MTNQLVLNTRQQSRALPFLIVTEVKRGEKKAAAKRNARRQNSGNDKSAEFGPPDKQCHFQIEAGSTSRGKKRAGTSENNPATKRPCPDKGALYHCQTKYLGKKLKMRFKIEGTNRYKWFNGQILNFDPVTGKYGAFFPCDNQTVYINPTQEAGDIIFS